MVGYAVFYLDCKRIKNGKYEIHFSEISRPPYEKGQTGIIKSFAETLEKKIQENPSQYLWSNKRWKYTKEEAEAELKRVGLLISK